MRNHFLIVIFSLLCAAVSIFAQTEILNSYEAEILMNPNKGGKDTRQVNAVIVLEKESVKIVSRRRNKIFKEFAYSDIVSVEHSYSKDPIFSVNAKTMMLTVLTGVPFFFSHNETHWITLLSENDFAVLKVENDNYRLLRNEFLIRKLKVEDINENSR